MNDTPNTDMDDLLTDAERAALQADEGADIEDQTPDQNTWATVDERAAAEEAERAAAAEDETGDPGDDAAAAEDAKAAEEAAKVATDDEAAAAAKKEAEPKAEPEAATEDPVDNSTPDTTEIEAKIEAFDAQAQKIMDDYEDGELSSEDMRKKLAEVQGQRDAAVREIAIAADRVNQVEKRWDDAVRTYIGANQGLTGDPATLDQYDAMVRFVTSNPAYANKSFEAQLQAAHRLLYAQAEDFGLKDVPPPPGAAKAKQDPAPKAEDPAPKAKPEMSAEDKKRAEEMKTPPTTLARVPQADIAGAGEGEFAALNALIDSGSDPERVEAELAKLSQEQRDRFSSSVY